MIRKITCKIVLDLFSGKIAFQLHERMFSIFFVIISLWRLSAERKFGAYFSKSLPYKRLVYGSIGSRVTGLIDGWSYCLSQGQLRNAEAANYENPVGNTQLSTNVLEKCVIVTCEKFCEKNSANNCAKRLVKKS